MVMAMVLNIMLLVIMVLVMVMVMAMVLTIMVKGADDNGYSQNSHRVCIMGLRCKFASTANWFKSKIVSFETKSFLQIQNTQTICMRNKNIANVRTREEGGVEADTRQ